MYLKDKKQKFLFLIFFVFSLDSFAFDFQLCKSSLQDILNDTNQLQGYGADLVSSRDALESTGKYSSANQLALPAIMVPIVRSSAFSLFTIGVFYDAMDFSKFAKKNAQDLYKNRMNDFHSDISLALTYMEKVAPVTENASAREDMKKIAMELRKLKAKFRHCDE